MGTKGSVPTRFHGHINSSSVYIIICGEILGSFELGNDDNQVFIIGTGVETKWGLLVIEV